MSDVLILPEGGKPWVLGLRDGEVVRLSARGHAHEAGRVYYAQRVFCGGQKDKPVEIKQMERAYERERKINASRQFT